MQRLAAAPSVFTLLLLLTACGATESGAPTGSDSQFPSATPHATPSIRHDGGAKLLRGPAPATPASPSASPSGTVQPGDEGGGSVTIKEIADDMRVAQQETDAYWSRHWSNFFTGKYSSPRVIGLYDGTNPRTAPRCEGKPLQADNAFYCRPGDFVAWDASLILKGAKIGDSWVYLVIAHEWGHAIQNRLVDSLVMPAEELQADCLAGAELYGAAADGRLTFEPGDEKELVDGLDQLADETSWTDTQDHGDAFQRISYFDRGRSGGVLACLPKHR